MRSKQLSQIVRSELATLGYRVRHKVIHDGYKNSIIYLPKMAILTSTEQTLARLKQRNNTLIFDPIDGRIPEELMKFADCIVAASWEGYGLYSSRYQTKLIHKIDHHVDPRIKPLSDHKAFNVGYFGNLSNTVITEKIEEYVDIVPVDTSSQKNLSWIEKPPLYSMHYAVRSYKENDGVKPATKIFTAAVCGSNVIIEKSNKEAVYWLGKDYPYLCDDTSEDSIIKTLQYARDTYGGTQWVKGLSVMNKVKDAVSYEMISKQFFDMIKVLDSKK